MINNTVERNKEIDLSNYDKYGDFSEFDFATKNPDKYKALKDMKVSYKKIYRKKEEYDYAIDNPVKYKTIKSIASYDKYKGYKDNIDKVKSKYENVNDRKLAVQKYVNSLSLTVSQKAILIKSEYSSFDKYNKQIVEYIDNKKQKITNKKKVIF